MTDGGRRLAAGLIALAAWAGLVLRFSASIELTGSVPAAVWSMLRYFTIIGNLIVAIVFSGVALGRRQMSTPFLTGGATLAILLVGIVYAVLLRGLDTLTGDARLASLLMHDVTPVLVPLYWLALRPSGGLRAHDPPIWLAVPILYFVYALIRGHVEGTYPYPFMDVAKRGWAPVFVTALTMALAFLAGGYGLVWLDRALGVLRVRRG